MKVLKWIGIVIGGLIVLILLAVGVLYALGKKQLSQDQNVGQPVAAATSPEAIARGDYLFHSVMGCEGCHGAGMMGSVFFDPAVVPDGPPFGVLYAPNITTGVGGVGGMSDALFERAIRHGIGNDGRTLFIMPAHEYNNLSDDDFAALLGFLRTLPPIDNPTPARAFTPMAYILAGAGQLGQTPFEQIANQAAAHPAMAASTSADYGLYLTHLAACRDCHGPNLTGAADPGTGAVTPDLSLAGELNAWTAEQFVTTMRTGLTPSGHQLTEDMPWVVYGTMSDDDLTAIYNYLHSLPGGN